MKGLFGALGLLITAAVGMGIYSYTLKQAAPAPGMAVTQNISLTGVKMDLVSIAQQPRGEQRADVSADAGDENVHRTDLDWGGPITCSLTVYPSPTKRVENAAASRASCSNTRSLQVFLSGGNVCDFRQG